MKIEKTKINKIPSIIWGEQSDKVYVSVHGRHSCKEEAAGVAELAAQKNIQVISFDLPEHGERKDSDKTEFTIQNAISEMNNIMNFVESRWSKKYLFAGSIGAYFSLVAYSNVHFEKSVFISPLLDLEELINNMMIWFDVDLKRLEKEKIIDTPMGEKLSWEYLQYVKQNKVTIWNNHISIIIGDHDELTPKNTVENFKQQYNCDVEFVPDGKHYLAEEIQQKQISEWMNRNI